MRNPGHRSGSPVSSNDGTPTPTCRRARAVRQAATHWDYVIPGGLVRVMMVGLLFSRSPLPGAGEVFARPSRIRRSRVRPDSNRTRRASGPYLRTHPGAPASGPPADPKSPLIAARSGECQGITVPRDRRPGWRARLDGPSALPTIAMFRQPGKSRDSALLARLRLRLHLRRSCGLRRRLRGVAWRLAFFVAVPPAFAEAEGAADFALTLVAAPLAWAFAPGLEADVFGDFALAAPDDALDDAFFGAFFPVGIKSSTVWIAREPASFTASSRSRPRRRSSPGRPLLSS